MRHYCVLLVSHCCADSHADGAAPKLPQGTNKTLPFINVSDRWSAWQCSPDAHGGPGELAHHTTVFSPDLNVDKVSTSKISNTMGVRRQMWPRTALCELRRNILSQPPTYRCTDSNKDTPYCETKRLGQFGERVKL